MTAQQLTLLDPVRPLTRTQQEVMEALRVLIGSSTTADIQKALMEHGIVRERNCIAKRLSELAEKGLVQRVGKDHDARGISRTSWRRT